MNLGPVLLFGLLGTFVCYGVFCALTITFNNKYPMTQFDGKLGKWEPLKLTDSESLMMCSLLCSSDVIAAVSLISFKK